MKSKKVLKSIESLKKQKEKHEEKIRDYEGKNYALIEYWEKEIEKFDDEIVKMEKRLKDGC